MPRSDADADSHATRHPGIDVLRGLAVLWVVLHHVHLRFVIQQVPVAELVDKPLRWLLFWTGYYAVLMFFVISGFLITSHSLRRWHSLAAIDVSAFYRLRFARIAPCLVALLVLLSGLHLAGVKGYVIDPARGSLLRAVFAALTFHVNYLEGTRGYLPGSWDVLWSLSIEESFYLAFPLVCRLLRRKRWLACVLLALIVIGPFDRVRNAHDAPWDEYSYVSCFDGIAFGCLAALLAPKLTWPRLALLLGCAAVVLIAVFRPTVIALGLVDTGLYVTVLELGVALICAACARGVEAGRVLSRVTAPLRAIGRASYEIYLTHMFVVLSATTLYLTSGATLSQISVWYVGEVLACIVLGAGVSRWYSEPMRAALASRVSSPARDLEATPAPQAE